MSIHFDKGTENEKQSLKTVFILLRKLPCRVLKMQVISSSSVMASAHRRLHIYGTQVAISDVSGGNTDRQGRKLGHVTDHYHLI